LQAETEDHAKFVVTGIASAYLLFAMKIKPLWAGFVIPAQPVLASGPPCSGNWVYATKHDGYRMIVRRDGPRVRLYTPMPMTGPRLPATARSCGGSRLHERC
jgi:hypothetical protein